MNIPIEDLSYVTSAEEIFYGGTLAAITLVLHGFGMVWTMHVISALKRRFAQNETFAFDRPTSNVQRATSKGRIWARSVAYFGS